MTGSPANPQPTQQISAARPAPTEAFTSFVEGLKITSVMQGPPLRLIINGRRYQEGDSVSEKYGVRLAGLDLGNRSLIFEDRTTAQVKIRY